MKIVRIALASVLAVSFTACDSEIVQDSGFDLWCGDELCQWRTDRGVVARVSTWHPKDYGVELVDTPTVISQEITSNTHCLKFRLIGNVDAEAQVALAFDFFGDGVVDYEQPIPGVRWKPQEVLVRLPDELVDGISILGGGYRLVLEKLGHGKAVFAELSASSVDSCEGDPIRLDPRPNGVPCSDNSDCRSGQCRDDASPLHSSHCGECASDADCGAEEHCDVVTSTSTDTPFYGCVAQASRAVGDPCLRDAVCASGICALLVPGRESDPSIFADGRCSECRTDAACGDGSLCGLTVGSGGETRRSCVVAASVGAGGDCYQSAECANGGCCFFRSCVENSTNVVCPDSALSR